MSNLRAVRVLRVVEVSVLEGHGTEAEPFRCVRYYYDLESQRRLAVTDPIRTPKDHFDTSVVVD